VFPLLLLIDPNWFEKPWFGQFLKGRLYHQVIWVKANIEALSG
jgi:hypothetical protein